MKFLCSVNRRLVQHLSASHKIAEGGNFSAFNNDWEDAELGSHKIAEEVGKRHGLCAWQLVGGKRQSNMTGLIQAGLIIIDVDNQADGKDKDGNKIQKQELTWAEAEQLEIVQKYLSLAYESPSTAPGWERFRLVFGLEKPIIDGKFYRWFSKYIADQIPGADYRALQVPNLFYGSHSTKGIMAVRGSYIPAAKIDEAYSAYITATSGSSCEQPNSQGPEDILTSCLVDTDDAVDPADLVSRTVTNVLDGLPVDDRSATMANVFKELIGWANWLNENSINVTRSMFDIAKEAFYNIYDMPHDHSGGKFNRILNSIQDPEGVQPAINIAGTLKENSAWNRLRRIDYALYDKKVPQDVRETLKQMRPQPVDSVASADAFALGPTPQPTPTPTPVTNTPSTPQTPNQLVQLQQTHGQVPSQFSDNAAANVIAQNTHDKVLYDSQIDMFFKYDEDEGLWFKQDEQHIKQKIISSLDTLCQCGIMPKYNNAMVESVYKILKGKLLRTERDGRGVIWERARDWIAFGNGVMDVKTLTFKEGQDREYYLRNRLTFDYDPKSKCPIFQQWLKDSLAVDQDIIIRAFCRAILTGYVEGERFLHLVGPGGTGKSTMQQLLVALAGFNGTHTTSLEMIETNKFETFNIIGKRLVNLTDESNYNKRMDTIKKLTSSTDTLRAERKYGKEIISFKPDCLVTIASNEHISSSDATSGLERRRLTVVMDKVVPPMQRRCLLDVHQDEIRGEFAAEMSGIVAWALDMDHQMMREVFQNPIKFAPSLAVATSQALLFNNAFVNWLDECCLVHPKAATPIGRGSKNPSTDEREAGYYCKNPHEELYSSYVNWCRACGHTVTSMQRWKHRTIESLTNILHVPFCKEAKDKYGKQVITGLRLKKADISSDRAAHGKLCLPTPVEYYQHPTLEYWKANFEKHDPSRK